MELDFTGNCFIPRSHAYRHVCKFSSDLNLDLPNSLHLI